MDAKEFIRERERMLNTYGRTDGFCNNIFCGDCPFNTEEGIVCNTEKAVDIVEKWSEEHPKRTYLDVLLESFPNTPMNENGRLLYVTCPYALGLEKHDERPCCKSSCTCDACWHREYNGGK